MNCPACGNDVSEGFRCKSCGFDFTPLPADPLATAPLPAAPPPPVGSVADPEPPAQATADFDLRREGAVSLLTPLTPAATEWVSEYISDDVPRRAGAIVVEQRYVGDLLDGIASHDLAVARSANASAPPIEESLDVGAHKVKRSSDGNKPSAQVTGKHVLAAVAGLVMLLVVIAAVSSGGSSGGSSSSKANFEIVLSESSCQEDPGMASFNCSIGVRNDGATSASLPTVYGYVRYTDSGEALFDSANSDCSITAANTAQNPPAAPGEMQWQYFCHNYDATKHDAIQAGVNLDDSSTFPYVRVVDPADENWPEDNGQG